MQQIGQIEQVDELGELLISEVIQRVHSNFTKFEKFMQKYKNKKVIVLCGNTGAGKSSIYNWMLGAGFEIEEKDGVGYLQPLYTNEQMYISKMGTTSTSITQTSIYDYIEELDQVLVDLPGFESTISDYHKLFIDLLFQKIITSYQTKIVYVLDSPSRELQNRGKDFIQFISQQIGLNSNNIQNIFLIINKYSENETDDVQIQRIKEQLQGRIEFQQEMLKNIYIIRKIKNNEMIQQIFSDKAKKSIIQKLIQSEIINVQSKYVTKLSSIDIINNYLMQKSTFYFKDLTEKYKKIMTLIENKQNFQIIPDKQQETNSNSSIPQTIEGLYHLYTCMITRQQSNIAQSEDFQNFKRIYDYFLPYQDHLSSYFCMNNLESGEITRFNSVIDHLKQTTQITNTQTDLNDQIDRQQLKSIENPQNTWIELFGDIAMIIVVVFKKVYWFYYKK